MKSEGNLKFQFLTLALLLISLPAFAGTTTLTGIIKDSQGNPLNGKLLMYLPVPAQDPATNTAIAPIPVTFRLINGAISGGAPLFDVLTINPGGLYYIARAYDTTGSLQFFGNYLVTGASFNLGSAVPTSVTTSNISYISPAGLTSVNTFTQNNIFKQTNSSTFYASQWCTTPGTLDQSCIQNIINNAACYGNPGGGCKIIIDGGPNATYNFTTNVFTNTANCPVNIGCAINFEGADRSVTIQITGNFDGFLIGSFVRIANLHIKGTANAAHSVQKCVDSGNATGVIIENNDFDSCSGTAINSGNNNVDWTIRNNRIHDGKLEGILEGLGSTGFLIANNFVERNGQNGIDITGSKSTIVGNTVQGNGGLGSGGNNNGIIVFSGNSLVDNNTFVGNTTTGNTERGIDIVCIGTAQSLQNNVFVGNTANNNTLDGIRLVYSSGTATCKGDTIIGNTLVNNGNWGLLEVAGGGGAYGNNVLGPNSSSSNTSGNLSADMTGVFTVGLTMIGSVAGCTTSGGASAFTGPCTNTVTWTGGWTGGTFPTTGYKASCIGNGIGAAVPLLQAIVAKTTTSVNVQTQQATGVNASFTNIECVANQ